MNGATPVQMPADPTDPAEMAELLIACRDFLARGGKLGDVTGLSRVQGESLFTIGQDLFNAGRYAQARDVFGHVLLHWHDDRRFMLAYAAALQMCEDYLGAIRLYTFAALCDLTDPTPNLRNCECLLGLGLRKEARATLDLVVRQCRDGVHDKLRARARALITLLDNPSAAAAKESTNA